MLGVELEPDLVAWGSANLAGFGADWASIRAAEKGVLGLPGQAPYDRILVSADPGRHLPVALVDQLGDPARMVIPVNGVMVRVDRARGQTTRSEHGYYRFVPLR